MCPRTYVARSCRPGWHREGEHKIVGDGPLAPRRRPLGCTKLHRVEVHVREIADPRRALLVAIVVFSCALATDPSVAQDSAEAHVRHELDLRRAAFERAISDNDPAAMARLYAPDALLFPPGAESVSGREAIQAFLARPRDYEIAHDILDLQVRGEMVLEFGRWTQHTKQDRAAVRGGWYFWLWRRQSDGSWLVDRDLWSSAPAP